MNYVIFPILHGVQDKAISNDYADNFISNIKENLSGIEKNYLVADPINWSKTSQYKQMEVFKQVEKGLWNQKLRQMKHTLGSDALWYARTRTKEGFFNDIHRQIDQSIAEKLYRAGKGARICLFGHSLGSQIVYNHCFESGIDIAVDGIFLAGSPFTAYSGMFENWGNIPPNLKGFAVNFFNKFDFISSRIAKVHPSKEIADRFEDYEVPVGWLNPLNYLKIIGALRNHTCYWESKFVAKIVAEYLKKLINSYPS
jgi:hypothetical protein